MSKSNDYDGSFISKSIDEDFPAFDNKKPLDGSESGLLYESKPQSDLQHKSEPEFEVQQEEIPAVGVKKVTFATDVKNTDVFKKVAKSGRSRRQEKTAIGLERRSMPQNWDDRSHGQQIWSMLNWIPLSKSLLQKVYDREYKLQVKDLKKMKK